MYTSVSLCSIERAGFYIDCRRRSCSPSTRRPRSGSFRRVRRGRSCPRLDGSFLRSGAVKAIVGPPLSSGVPSGGDWFKPSTAHFPFVARTDGVTAR